MTTDDIARDTGASVTPTGLSQAEPVSRLGPSGFDPSRKYFTGADFGRVLSKMSANLARKTSEVAYGMWNPTYCSADADYEAEVFFAALETEAKYWRAVAASAIEARRAATGNTDAAHESAAPQEDAHD